MARNPLRLLASQPKGPWSGYRRYKNRNSPTNKSRIKADVPGQHPRSPEAYDGEAKYAQTNVYGRDEANVCTYRGSGIKGCRFIQTLTGYGGYNRLTILDFNSVKL